MHYKSIHQSIARGPFQLSRRDRELLPFSLMLRDEIENFFLSVSCFETRSRISVSRSRASRREWEFDLTISCFETRARFFLISLVLRDENENFYFQSHASRREREFLLSVSFFETRISVLTLVLRDENENNVEGWLPLFLAQSIIKKNSDEWIL